MYRRTLCLLALGLTFVASAEAETIRKKISNSDLVYTWVANESNSTRITTMWQKSNSDIDVYAGFVDDGELRLQSFGSTDGLEVAEFGVIQDSEYFVILHLFSGGSTKFQMNVSTAGYETVSREGEPGGLSFLGRLDDLAAVDERFASLASAIEASSDRKVQAQRR